MLGRVGVYLEMIKVAHTVFALPFALMGAFLAARGIPSSGCFARYRGPKAQRGVPRSGLFR